jgi:hypothetical protein
MNYSILGIFIGIIVLILAIILQLLLYKSDKSGPKDIKKG